MILHNTRLAATRFDSLSILHNLLNADTTVLYMHGDDPGDSSVHRQIIALIRDRHAAESYQRAMDQTKALFEQVSEVYIPPLQQFSGAFLPLIDRVMKESGLFHPLYLIEGSHQYTYRHSVNVGMLSALIAKLLNRPPEEIARIGQAGLLHDAGKMLIPQEILMKPGKLTDEEFAVMKEHTTRGAELLQQMEGTSEIIVQTALLHHERLDGTGYPFGRKEGMIPLECQIVSVADVFDAVCSDRIYKSRTSPFEAAGVLWRHACEGSLNPHIVTPFIQYIASLYVGCRALLNNGRQVEVVFIHTDEPMRPLVRDGETYLDLRRYRDLTIEKMIG